MSYQDDHATWEAHLASDVHWKEAYAYVGERARTYLLGQASTLTTTALATALYDGPDDFTTQRVFQALQALGAHALHDCWQPGEPVTARRFGKVTTIRPKVWRSPPAKTCPHCGGNLE